MNLWKCCTQYARTFGKLSSGHRTGKGQFSFQCQRKSKTKNVQITAQLHSSHTLAKKCSKFSKWDFNSAWTENFLTFKLDLEMAEEPEINVNIRWIIEKAREFQKNIFCFLTAPKPLTVWITRNYGKFLKEVELPDHLTCFPRNLYAYQEATVRNRHGITDWFQLGKEYVKAVYCHPAYLTPVQSTLCTPDRWTWVWASSESWW